MNRLSILAIFIGVAACSATKEEWMTRFEATMPDRLCSPDFVFVHCYDIDQASCRTLVAPIAHTCTAKLADQLPDHVDMADGRKYGEIAGACIGNQVTTLLEKKIRQPIDPKCQDPKAWH